MFNKTREALKALSPVVEPVSEFHELIQAGGTEFLGPALKLMETFGEMSSSLKLLFASQAMGLVEAEPADAVAGLALVFATGAAELHRLSHDALRISMIIMKELADEDVVLDRSGDTDHQIGALMDGLTFRFKDYIEFAGEDENHVESTNEAD